MKNVSVQLSEEFVETLDEEASELDLSRAQYIRELIQKGRDSREIESELEESRREIDRLKRELRATNARQDDVGELVEYIEEERELQLRERERRDAPAWRRAKWWLLGRSEA